MEFEPNDMRVLGIIKRGETNLRGIKNIMEIKKDELTKILDILDESQLITSSYGAGLFGQKKLIIEITENGSKKIDNYVTISNRYTN